MEVMRTLKDMLDYITTGEQDRAIDAVMKALTEVGVMSYNPEQAYYRFTTAVVSAESLSKALDRHLGSR